MKAFYADQFDAALAAGPIGFHGQSTGCCDRIAAEIRWCFSLAPAANDGELALVHAPDYIRGIATGRADTRILRDRLSLEQGDGCARTPVGGRHHRGLPRPCWMARAWPPTSRAGRTTPCRSRWWFLRVQRCGGGGAPDAGGTGPSWPRTAPGRRFRWPSSTSMCTRAMAPHASSPAPACSLSLHGEKNFPFCKEASDLDVPLPDGCDDDTYLHALDLALDELTQRFEPGLVIYPPGRSRTRATASVGSGSGYDGLEARDRRVFEWAWQRRVPLAPPWPELRHRH